MTRYIYNTETQTIKPVGDNAKAGKSEQLLEADYTPEQIARWLFDHSPADAKKIGEELDPYTHGW